VPREASILQQVEFYFSDVNLFGDQFLTKKISSDPEGYVELDVLLTFNRLLAENVDLQLLQNCLRSSKKLVLNEDASKVKRLLPFTPVIADNIHKKSLYLTRFPRTVTEEELRDLFLPSRVQNVKFFRNKFSARLTFLEELEVSTVLSNHKEKPYTLHGSTLVLSSFLDQQQKKASQEAKTSFEKKSSDTNTNTNTKRKRKQEEDVDMVSRVKKKKKVKVSTGSTLQFTVSVPSKKLKANFLRKVFEKYGTVEFLDGPNSGQLFGIKCYVRYQSPDQAKTAFEQLAPEYQNQIQFVLLDGKACKEYEARVNKVIQRKNVLLEMAS